MVIIGGGLGLSERNRGWMWDSEEQRARPRDGGSVRAELLFVVGLDVDAVEDAAAGACSWIRPTVPILQLLSLFDCQTESLISGETADVSHWSKACCSNSWASSLRDTYLSKQEEALESRLVWKDCV